MELLKRIDMALEKSGKTRADLARELGISTQAITSLGKRPNAKMKHENLVKAAQALSCTVEWLATGKGQKPKPRVFISHHPTQYSGGRHDDESTMEREMRASMLSALYMDLGKDDQEELIRFAASLRAKAPTEKV